jgi:hypothetical protein
MTTPSSTPGDMGAEPPGLPDSAMLARLANELFAENLGVLDQPAVAPGHLIGGPQLPAAPSLARSVAPLAPSVAPLAPSVAPVAPPVGPSGDLIGNVPNSIDEGAEVDLALPGGGPPGGGPPPPPPRDSEARRPYLVPPVGIPRASRLACSVTRPR